MLDIKKLRESFQEVKDSLSSRGYDIDLGLFQSLDEKRKVLQITVENLQAERKKLSAEYGKLKASGDDVEQLKSTIDENNTELEAKDKELQIILIQINDFLLDIPNIPDGSVPEGKNENDNVVIKQYGSLESKNTLDHLEITGKIDTDLAAKLAGARGHFTFAGTPEQVADELEAWFKAGAADGFNLMPPIIPWMLDVFVEEVIPLLQRRGLFREVYAGTMLRDHYGLERPQIAL